MASSEINNMPEAELPQFKNAQAVEEAVDDRETASPTSPVFGQIPRSGSTGSNDRTTPPFKYDMFGLEKPDGIQEAPPLPQTDRRMSKEWDASKVPPSRFQKRAGSIHATPASRDGHIERNNRLALFEKLSKGKSGSGERRKSQS
ncbi:hypothetical protein TWF696_006501 [Orbilia brochopaga]|uniref:Uncharacterized protein n=1 Tax=Orbilia brochopaga TaxID=3140254 RepID=A0AAV9UWI0_9PEZI